MEKTSNITANISTKRLSILVTTNGLSFCISHSQTEQIEFYNEVFFDFFSADKTIEENLKDYFATHAELGQKFVTIKVIHHNNMYELVPDSLFDENYLASYLQFSNKVYESDYIDFDEVNKLNLKNVFIPNIRVNNFLLEQFGAFDFFHGQTTLLNKCYEIHQQNLDINVFLHLMHPQIDLLIYQENQLKFCNSFVVNTEVDVLYYVLFCLEQLKIDPQTCSIKVFGNIYEQDNNFKMLSEYIKDVNFLALGALNEKSFYTESVNRKHYILFES